LIKLSNVCIKYFFLVYVNINKAGFEKAEVGEIVEGTEIEGEGITIGCNCGCCGRIGI
jgi:hypothetical protein